MMKKYGTPATEGDIQRAQFLNYLKAPKPLQQAMQQYGHDSDAYRGIQNSMASAQEDMGIRQGTPEPARAWLASQQSPQGQVQAADLVQRTVGGLGPSHPLTQMLNPQAEAERVARRQAARAEQTPVNARGVAGATYGNVNGVDQLVPQAGHYQEFQGAMAAEGLNGQMGVDRGRFEQARSALVRQQEASRRQTKLEAKQATDRSNAAALALEDRKQANALALKLAESGYTQKDMVGFHADQLKQWQSDQTKAAELDRLASTAVNGRVMTKDGPVSLTAIQAQADGLKRDRPTYAQSLEALGTPQSNALAGSLPPGQQSIGAMARGAFNSVFGGQKAASAPAQSGKKETLGPNARKQYAAMDPAKRETYAAHYEQEGKPWLASEIRSL